MSIEESLKAFTECKDCARFDSKDWSNLPSLASIAVTLRRFFDLFFPGMHGHVVVDDGEKCVSKALFLKIASEIEEAVKQVLGYVEYSKSGKSVDFSAKSREITEKFMAELVGIRTMLREDVQAAYEGDPAAVSTMEVVMAYPCIYAITVHRVAHALYRLGVPILPRVMSEQAHARTGIDIHPGARIGERFFIDHGTGVVIGETCVIGKNVKLYQGVTLGALSFPKDEETGVLVKGIKRHPNVEDNVVIYAGATILGGDTTIGHDSEIGGNVWLMNSIPPYSRVYNRPPAPNIRNRKEQK